MRISDCGLKSKKGLLLQIRNPKSAFRNRLVSSLSGSRSLGLRARRLGSKLLGGVLDLQSLIGPDFGECIAGTFRVGVLLPEPFPRPVKIDSVLQVRAIDRAAADKDEPQAARPVIVMLGLQGGVV